MHWASCQGDDRIVQEIINYGADINALDVYGQTSLFDAVISRKLNGVYPEASRLFTSTPDSMSLFIHFLCPLSVKDENL